MSSRGEEALLYFEHVIATAATDSFEFEKAIEMESALRSQRLAALYNSGRCVPCKASAPFNRCRLQEAIDVARAAIPRAHPSTLPYLIQTLGQLYGHQKQENMTVALYLDFYLTYPRDATPTMLNVLCEQGLFEVGLALCQSSHEHACRSSASCRHHPSK